MSIPIWPNPAGAPGSETNPIGTRVTTSTVTAALTTLAAGLYYVLTGASATVQLIDGATTATVTNTILAANSGGYIFSDGSNVIIANNSTASTASHYYPIAGL